MVGRLLRIFIALPLLLAVWAAANTIGVTASLQRATGVDIPDGFTIPGLKQVIDARNVVDEQTDAARAEVRRRAVAALRAEIQKRYGPEAAALVPANLTISEARRITEQVIAGASLPQIKDMLGSAPKAPTQPKPDNGSGNGSGGGSNTSSSNSGGNGGGAATYATARKRLAALPVKGRAAKAGYDRDQFGSAWSDAAGNFGWTRNGCDTRNDLLKRDLVKVTFKAGTGNCKVLTGLLPYEPYTGKKNYRFDATDDSYATDLDAEHIVALGNAWVTGAQQWSKDKRAAFANDPVNLMMVDPSSNRQKGDADFATWLPKNKAFRCDYAAKQIAIKTRYGLWVTKAEKEAMGSVLAKCG